MGCFSLFLTALVDPVAFFTDRVTRRGQTATGTGTGAGLAALLVGVLSAVLAGILISGERGETARRLFSGFGTTFVFLMLLSLVFKGALFHLFSGMWGKRGSGGDLLRFLLFSWLPFLFLLPAALLLKMAGLEGLYTLVFMGVLGYSYKMEVSALQVVYGLPGGRAVLVFLIPLLFQLVFVFVFLLGFISTVAGLLLRGSGLL